MRVILAILALIAMIGDNSYRSPIHHGKPVWRGYEIAALATPWGPIYFGDSENNPFIRNHEMCHVRRMKEVGSMKFLYHYFTDEEFACREERICGWYGPHPMCTKKR